MLRVDKTWASSTSLTYGESMTYGLDFVFVESPVFTRQVKELLTDEQYVSLQWHLALYPKAGRVIQDTGGLRKLRWVSGGGGKRGGVRVIYFHAVRQHQIRLLLIYHKAIKDDLSAAEKKALRELNKNW